MEPGDSGSQANSEDKSSSYTFDDLEHVYKLPCGIEIYDNTSFSKQDPSHILIPDDPKLVILDKLTIKDKETEVSRDLGSNMLLTFHGYSDKECWVQGSRRTRKVQDILKEIDDCEVKVDALHVCNAGGYRLPAVNGRNKYTYGIGLTYGSFSLCDGRLVCTMSGKIQIKGEPER